MAKHVISVCIFCFICATHSPCASHAGVGHENPNNTTGIFDDSNNPPVVEAIPITSREKLKLKNHTSPDENRHFIKNNLSLRTHNEYNNDTETVQHNIVKRNSINDLKNVGNNKSTVLKNEDYLKKLFLMYGDGEFMTIEGFEKLMQHLDINKLKISAHSVHLENESTGEQQTEKIKTEHNITCMNREEIFAAINPANDSQTSKFPNVISDDTLKKACPAILYSMLVGGCVHEEAAHLHLAEAALSEREQDSPLSVWLYSCLAVILISACGLLGLAVIPVMQKRFYQPLLQFLVALAVGTLAGDAWLHLFPHAMFPDHGHDHGTELSSVNSHDYGSDENKMWIGFIAMSGLVFFFFMERFIIFIAKWRKGHQLKKKLPSRLKIMKPDGSQPKKSGEKQCMNKYSSFPLCYNEILDNEIIDVPDAIESLYTADTLETDKTATTILDELGSNSGSFKKSRSCSHKLETNQNMTECPSENTAVACTEINKMLENDKDYTVILREHQSGHHGHSHTHGHVHAAPVNMSSVALMVIMGDGLHNFTDGMAIGAAFAGSIAGGFSTAVAVFCHELPHELGDFAMLLRAGMSMKQALFYNLLSSVLCFLGNIIGVWLGNTEYTSRWIFAAAAGMFIYIALVDMIPELSSGHEDEGNLVQYVLHLGGLLLGFGIMTVIALYEHDLKNIFDNPV